MSCLRLACGSAALLICILLCSSVPARAQLEEGPVPGERLPIHVAARCEGLSDLPYNDRPYLRALLASKRLLVIKHTAMKLQLSLQYAHQTPIHL